MSTLLRYGRKVHALKGDYTITSQDTGLARNSSTDISNVQYPNLRASYAHFPTAAVPGADYYVGANPDTAFKFPTIDAPPDGCWVNSARKQFWINTTVPLTLSRWRFSGWQVIGDSFTAPVDFVDCYWEVLDIPDHDDQQPPVHIQANCSGDVSFTDCTILGNGHPMGDFDAFIDDLGTGEISLLRCDLDRSYDDIVQVASGGTKRVTIDKSLLRNNGRAPTFGPHPDHLQVEGSGTFTVTVTNSLLMNVLPGGIGTQYIFLPTGGPVQTFVDTLIDGNVMIAGIDANTPNYFVSADMSRQSTFLKITNNWLDPRGLLTPSQCFNVVPGTGPYFTTATITGNINMNTGATISA